MTRDSIFSGFFIGGIVLICVFFIALFINTFVVRAEIRTNCIDNCKPQRILFCDSKHVVCDSLDGGKLIIFEEKE